MKRDLVSFVILLAVVSVLGFRALGDWVPVETATGAPQDELVDQAFIPGEQVYCDAASGNAKAAFLEMGFEVTSHPEQADLLWMRRRARAYYPKLKYGQLINHIPGHTCFSDKGKLARYLHRYEATRGGSDRSITSFYPETYALNDSVERERFLEVLSASDESAAAWIFKPTSRSEGKGIRIVGHDEAQALATTQSEDDVVAQLTGSSDSYVVQRYLADPFLLDGRKSEIRTYLVVASVDPLLVLIYHDGRVRSHMVPFTYGDFYDAAIHVNNNTAPKAGQPGYNGSVPVKRTFGQLEEYLVANYDDIQEGYVDEVLKGKIKQCVQTVFQAVRSDLCQKEHPEQHFGVYGADFMLDSSLEPWLVEMQAGPALKYQGVAVKQDVIPFMLADAGRIALDVRTRIINDEPLDGLDTRGFEWVINEAAAIGTR